MFHKQANKQTEVLMLNTPVNTTELMFCTAKYVGGKEKKKLNIKSLLHKKCKSGVNWCGVSTYKTNLSLVVSIQKPSMEGEKKEKEKKTLGKLAVTKQQDKKAKNDGS